MVADSGGEAPGRGEATASDAGHDGPERQLIVAKWGPGERSSVAPLVFVRNRKKRGRKRYTRGTRDFQLLQRAVTRASLRLSKAGTIGLSGFERASRRSARRERDGAMVDAPGNLARAMEEGLREASRAPIELARGINGRLLWAPARATARLVIPSAWRR